MSHLIEELKKDHVALLGLLEEIKIAGVTSEEGKKKLAQAKNVLIAHLKKEDQDLYPILHTAAKSDSKLNSILNVLAKNMDGISQFAMEFFTLYANGGEGIQFAKDFGKLYGTLVSRIRKEETILYAEFVKLNR